MCFCMYVCVCVWMWALCTLSFGLWAPVTWDLSHSSKIQIACPIWKWISSLLNTLKDYFKWHARLFPFYMHIQSSRSRERERAGRQAHSQVWGCDTCLAERDDDSKGSFPPPSFCICQVSMRALLWGWSTVGGGLSVPRDDTAVREMITAFTEADMSRYISSWWSVI